MIPGGTLTSLYSNMKDCCIYILLHSPEFSVKGLSSVSLSLFHINVMIGYSLRREKLICMEY